MKKRKETGWKEYGRGKRRSRASHEFANAAALPRLTSASSLLLWLVPFSYSFSYTFCILLNSHRSPGSRQPTHRHPLPFAIAMPSEQFDYDAVRRDIAASIPDENHDDGSRGPLLVRLAWVSWPCRPILPCFLEL